MRGRKEVSNKHYCQICKIWIENHPNNLRSHQEGGRHKYNLRKLLKSENYRDSQKKKNEEEIRKEFMKLQGVVEKPSQEKKTIKQIDKVKSTNSSVFADNVFKNSHSHENLHNCFESEDYNENHTDKKNQMGIIGQWEEVKESESAFLGDTNLKSQPHNPFKFTEGCVQIKKNNLSQKVYSCISELEGNFEEHQFDQKLTSNIQKLPDEKIKIVFKTRKTPNQIRKD
ncbi:uncharacterized protein cubi_00952 [Cryptosporidium ubiquitum]|uniref:Matrin-type domain-containing protein n=1 Tax=Cryptosporidium ubiquitum TaxID=857276 RepID=A0A1J4M9Y7_9CRYT|nr:uncharacterized protein cubi_00952 [Cryptosporidium ubiquitum]OII70807.1 hypothetical protein cubi_00952 [Cryptosporidium ubiquitum]